MPIGCLETFELTSIPTTSTLPKYFLNASLVASIFTGF